MEKLIESLKNNKDSALCFYGMNDGVRRAERLYLCFDSNYNLYSRLLWYEPLLGKAVRIGDTTWEKLMKELENHELSRKERWNSIRLIHYEYHATGMDTDHGVQVCGFDSLKALMDDIMAPDHGKIGHCLLANPKSPRFDHHGVLTKEQMFKDAIKFGQDKKDWKFLFEWGDNVGEICNAHTPTPPKILKPKDQRYCDLKELKWHIEELLKLDPGNKYKDDLLKIMEELKEYEE